MLKRLKEIDGEEIDRKSRLQQAEYEVERIRRAGSGILDSSPGLGIANQNTSGYGSGIGLGSRVGLQSGILNKSSLKQSKFVNSSAFTV